MRRIRVAVHVHSDWSYDGQWSLERISAAFGRRGYDAVLLAEHDRGFDAARWAEYQTACAAAGTARTLLVPGIEYSDPTNTVHVPVWGDIPFLGDRLETAELFRRIEPAGGLAVLAHPGRRDAWRRIRHESFRSLIGIELWNRKYDGYAPNRVAAELLRARPELVPIVSLDFHTARQFHPLAMVLELEGQLSTARVFESIRQRRARPIAYRVSAASLAHGPALPAMCGVERVRRGLAAQLRRAGHRRG